MKKFWLSSLLGGALALAAGAHLTTEVLAVPETFRLAHAKPLLAQAAPVGAPVSTATANPKADITPTDVTDDEVPANWFDGMIPVVAPILLWLFSLGFPKIPRAFLPFLAPGLGYLIDLLGSATGLSASNPLMGALLGASGVAVREMLNQTTKAMDNRTGKITLLLLLCGCAALPAQAGCTRLHITQSEVLSDGAYRETDVNAHSFFDSKSELAKLRTTMTDKTQGVGVSGLMQEASSTGAVQVIKILVETVAPAARAVVP